MRRNKDTLRADARLLIDSVRWLSRTDAADLSQRWASTDAAALIALAEAEGAGLALHQRLKALGIKLGGDASDRLATIAKRAVAQQMRADAELRDVLAAVRATRARAVPLKGSAMRRLRDRVPFADSRASADIDLIVSPGDAERVWNALAANGYTAPKPGPDDEHHLPVLVGRNGIGVEIHMTTHASITPAEAWRRVTYENADAGFNGESIDLPSDTELLWHSIVHAVGHADESGDSGVRLRYWLDCAALLAGGGPFDWARIVTRLQSRECARPALAATWLATAADLSGRPLPREALGGTRAQPLDLERLLAWRLDISARNIGERWRTELLEEGARGEARLPANRGYPDKGIAIRSRHYLASRAARCWWLLRR